MDGRRFRWCLYGGLFVCAVGCHRNTYPNSVGLLKPGQSAAGLPPMDGGMLAKKPVWGGGPAPQSAGPTVPGMPAEVAAAPKKRKGPLSAETEVEFANTHLEVALADPPPANRDQLIDLARMRYQRALKQDHKHKGALLGMARMYAKLGDREKAGEAYQKYVELYPKDADVYHEIAMRQAQWKDWENAVRWCEVALKQDPENRAYRKTMGFCLARAGKWEEAFATLCEIMPEAQARHNLAGLLDHMGQTEACKAQLRLAVQADPDYAPAKEFLAGLEGTPPPGAAAPGGEPNPVRTVGHTEEP